MLRCGCIQSSCNSEILSRPALAAGDLLQQIAPANHRAICSPMLTRWSSQIFTRHIDRVMKACQGTLHLSALLSVEQIIKCSKMLVVLHDVIFNLSATCMRPKVQTQTSAGEHGFLLKNVLAGVHALQDLTSANYCCSSLVLNLILMATLKLSCVHRFSRQGHRTLAAPQLGVRQ